MALILATKGNFYLLNQYTTVYRVHIGGVFTRITNEKDKRLEVDFNNLRLLENFNFYSDNLHSKDINRIISNYSQRILTKYTTQLSNTQRKDLVKKLNFFDRVRLFKNKIKKSIF